jgi:nucleotide-binding universal stress UspA family protein
LHFSHKPQSLVEYFRKVASSAALSILQTALCHAFARPAVSERVPRGAEHISDLANTGDPDAAEALFVNLDTQDADLIVVGAFGRSRIYEGGRPSTSCTRNCRRAEPHWRGRRSV